MRKLLMLFFLLPVACNTEHQCIAVITTDSGKIEVTLYREQVPVTVNNFIDLSERGVYDNAVFYRVVRLDNQPFSPVKIEVIQGGLCRDELIESYNTILHETTDKTGVLHLNGTISMARNEPGTASTEFFICIGDQPELDYGGKRNPDGAGFAAFGRVIKGMGIVRKIQQLPDSSQYLTEPVVIKHIEILEK